MTAIGKMLVFLVLILSLVWTFLTLNAYSARTNWQKEAKKYQTEAQSAAESATKMRALLESTTEANEDAKRAIIQERERYYSQVAQLQTQLTSLTEAYNKAFTEAQNKQTAAAQLQAMIDKLTGQVSQLDADLKKMEVERNDAVTRSNRDRGARQEAEIARDSYKLGAEKNGEKVNELLQIIAEMKNGTASGIPGFRTPVAPAGFRGTVSSVSAEGGQVYVQLTPGLDAGLQKDTTLDIQRTTPAGRYLGKLKIVSVDNKNAVGILIPATKGVPPTGDALPRKGDEIVPQK
ncbi:MAG: hypothetical protein ACRC8S_20795 [Fimbriiglobus sp.]